MIRVGRHIEGVTLNPLEYLLTDDSSEVMEFTSETTAKCFLRSKGIPEEEYEEYTYENCN